MTDDRTPTLAAGDHASAEELSALVDGELDERRAPAVLEHVAACSACTEARARLGEVRRLLRDLDAEVPAGGREAAVAVALEAARREATADEPAPIVAVATLRRRRGVRRRKVAGIAAAVILAAGVASGVGVALSSSNPPRTSATGSVPQARLGGAGEPPGGPVDVRTPAPGPVVAEISRGDVSSVQLLHLGHGQDGLVVTLRPGREAVVDAVRSGEVVTAGGRVLGAVHALGPLRIEVTGLSAAGAAELEADLGG